MSSLHRASFEVSFVKKKNVFRGWPLIGLQTVTVTGVRLAGGDVVELVSQMLIVF
jgi:hypothetical protein